MNSPLPLPPAFVSLLMLTNIDLFTHDDHALQTKKRPLADMHLSENDCEESPDKFRYRISPSFKRIVKPTNRDLKKDPVLADDDRH